MATVLVRVEQCGEHLDLGRPLPLTAILADLDFVMALMHARHQQVALPLASRDTTLTAYSKV
jgi:hypothetical protein